jgi:uncharacterized membrane protein YbhN (UPF0104 family)
MLKKWLLIVSYLILTGVIISLILYFGKDILVNLTNVNPWLIGILSLLQIPMIALGGLAFQILCTRFNIQLRWQDWIGLSFIANFLNQLLPYRPGAAFRLFYLHRRYHMTVNEFIYVMVIYLLLTLAVSALFTLTGWLTSDLPKNYDSIPLLALVLLFLIACIIYGLKQKKSLIGFNNTAFHKILNALHLLINNPGILAGAFFSLILSNLFNTVIFYLTFKALHMVLPFSHCSFLVGIMVLAMIFPITPGNIGILEALIGTLTQMMYNDFSIGFSVVALFRASQWIPSLIFGSLFSTLLMGTLFPKFSPLKLGANKRVD